MANFRKQAPDKIGADCPHCGFSQLESVNARSTFCRQCGQHYSIEKLLAKEVASLRPPSFFDKLSKLVSRETSRVITCFSCRETHEVSSDAQSSLCPHCGSYIDIRDFRIAGPFARSIQTQGLVHLAAGSDVASHRLMCGSARVEGRFRGKIVCTGEVTFRLEGVYEGGVEAEKLVVHPKAKVEFVTPVYARAIEVNGSVKATVVCDKIVIGKKGTLEGAIYARTVTIEKGGIFSGSMAIGQEPPEELRRPEEKNWFSKGASAEQQPLPAEDFADLPPSVLGMEEEEPLHQPSVDFHLRRPRRRK